MIPAAHPLIASNLQLHIVGNMSRRAGVTTPITRYGQSVHHPHCPPTTPVEADVAWPMNDLLASMYEPNRVGPAANPTDLGLPLGLRAVARTPGDAVRVDDPTGGTPDIKGVLSQARAGDRR